MEVRCLKEQITNLKADWLIVPLAEPATLSGELQQLDQALGQVLTRLIESGDFTGKLGSTLILRGLAGIAASRLLLIGTGTAERASAATRDRAFRTATRAISDKPDLDVAIWVAEGSLPALRETVEAAVTAGFVGSVGQDLYRTERTRYPFRSLTVASATAVEDLQAAVERGKILGESINLTRELVNLSPQDLTPTTFAQRAETLAGELGLALQVLDEPQLRAEQMGSLLAVAKGSTQPPRMVVLEYRGAGADVAPLAIVGKGVTFDSGGLSLKPSDSMITMKCDMAGAATALGAICAIARLRIPVNVTAFMGLVENMPSGSAFKLGDVLKARNGVTIEVLNTDAEGRLVLADVLSYAVDRGVDRIVDLATLTGACVVALGEDVTGAFTNNQNWCDAVLAASRTAGEDVWQLPMFDLYDELIKGEIGDIKNTGGRWGGAITAAKFLQRFVADKPWVHLDIAGPSFASSNKPHREGGGTGCMVKTLVELARQQADAIIA